MYIAHTVLGRYTLKLLSLGLYLEEEDETAGAPLLISLITLGSSVLFLEIIKCSKM